MRLAKLSEFRRLIYAQDAGPSLPTLRAWVRAGRIAGGQVEGGHYWVDLDEYNRAHNVRVGIAAREQKLAENPLLAGLV